MTATERQANQACQELTYYRFLLRHIAERLNTLKPGVTTTHSYYADLVDQKRQLTLLAIGAIVKTYGKHYDPDSDSLYVVNNVCLPLGGTYRARV